MFLVSLFGIKKGGIIIEIIKTIYPFPSLTFLILVKIAIHLCRYSYLFPSSLHTFQTDLEPQANVLTAADISSGQTGFES